MIDMQATREMAPPSLFEKSVGPKGSANAEGSSNLDKTKGQADDDSVRLSEELIAESAHKPGTSIVSGMFGGLLDRIKQALGKKEHESNLPGSEQGSEKTKKAPDAYTDNEHNGRVQDAEHDEPLPQYSPKPSTPTFDDIFRNQNIDGSGTGMNADSHKRQTEYFQA
jgi:hypothetical protein